LDQGRKNGRLRRYRFDALPPESCILIVTFAPDKAGKKELRLEEAEALQLAAALASVRQNVSEAGQ
jgi:hypothetical protein